MKPGTMDKFDSKIYSNISQLESYGLLGIGNCDRLISQQSALKIVMKYAEERIALRNKHDRHSRAR